MRNVFPTRSWRRWTVSISFCVRRESCSRLLRLLATTRDHLQRALRFATNGIPFPVYFLIADPAHLAEGLERHYPMGAFGRRVVDGELEHLASNLASRHEDAA